jgi:isopenicillin-N epimerase
MDNLKSLFLLDPTVVFLNHGSFGATPAPVMKVYQEWQRRLEWEPVQFIDQELPSFLYSARRDLGNLINASADDLVFVPNATFGINVVARSLSLGQGDQVLTTNHEYGACDNVWSFLSRKHGFDYVQQPVDLPLTTPEAIVETIWQGVTDQTRAIFISHITSSTAIRLPVEKICALAREKGILTIVDGAHALGQIPLDMKSLGADFYTGNGHKWLCSPKGSAFLFTRREKQHLIEPLIVGWGWGEERATTFGSDYLDFLQWLGTDDLSAYLSVPAAIKFQAEYDWLTVRQGCHEYVRQVVDRICHLTNLNTVYADDAYYHQMAIAPLPDMDNPRALQRRLYQEYRIEVPCVDWHGKPFIRISVQGYNSQSDIDKLLEALEKILKE